MSMFYRSMRDGRKGLTEIQLVEGHGVKHGGKTYETLDALLIANSPGYVKAMGDELSRRFEGYQQPGDRD
jgi:hypothetical protein